MADERANSEGANKGSNNQTQAPSTENRRRKSKNYWQKRKEKKQQKKQQQQQQQREIPPPPQQQQQQQRQQPQRGEKSSTSKNRERARRKPQEPQASGYAKKELPVRPDRTGRIAGQPRNTSTYYEKGRFNLNAMKELSPSEVQSVLACHAKGLKSRVQSGNEENEEAQDNISLLRALALACNAGKSENLTKILSAIKGSKFLCNQLPSMLREMQQDEQGALDELSKRQVIVDMINLYQTFLRSLPSAYSDLPLDEVQRYFRKISITDKDDLQTKLDALKTERDEYIQDMRIKSTKPCKQRNINKKPPNNFRELQICPTVQELASEEKPFLRANVKKGSYENVEHYLDVQFRLYREDFITPLRDGIREIVHKVPRAERDQNIKTYDKVQIKKKEYSRNGVIYTIHFDVSRFKTTRWDSSRRLIFGSFLCLSKDNFVSILFATVANRDPKQLSKGYLDISFVEGQNIHGIELRKSDQYVMAESQAYFEAYRHVLAALQNLRDGSLPFQKYLVECSREVDAPAYLRDQDKMVCYDLREALDVSQVKEAMDVPLLDSDKWPDVSQLPLNDSQYEALRTALTKEFSVIQGPPGTGKTYVGLKIARCLLTNSHAWNPTNDSPILMVCFTNHALDQFLEGILDFLKDGIIRVGSRCKSERLDRCNLKIKVNIGYEQRQANRVKLAKQQRRIESSKKVFEELDRHDDIIRIDVLEDSSCISKENLDNLYFSSLYGEECKSLQDVFESWICNKANTRIEVNSSEVTLEFKPDCPVPSQRQTEADDAQKDTEEGNDSDDEQGWGVANPDLPRTLTSCDDEDSDSSDLDENNAEGNEDTAKNSDNTEPIKDFLQVDQAKPFQVNSESAAEYPEGNGEDPRSKQDDLRQENSDMVVESQKMSDTILNAYASLNSLQPPGDVIDSQAFNEEDATQDDADGWTEVKSKKKTTMQRSLPQPTAANENQEMLGSSKQQIDLKDVESNNEDTAGSNEVETIDIQQEMDYEQQTRYIVGEEDAFRPINLTLEFSDLHGDTFVEQSERENFELSKGEITNENAPNALQEASDPKSINKTCEDQSMNVEKARQNHPERVEREESATDPLESMLNQETNKKKNTKNKATAKDIREAKEKMKNLTKMREEEIVDIKDIWVLTHDNRLRLYLTWVDMLKEYYKQRIIQEEQAYDGVCKEIDNLRMVEEEQILKQAKVIGMTTTGAARYHSVLQRIKPRIVIIEEAAEVLEAHIITSLARDTEQIILIGDHKQLRPKPTMYNLAIKYNLEISLFERMVLNDMDCKMLSIQHRMRPEIAHLTKRIYEETIHDHETVTEFENVRGMKTNLFFLDHRETESFKGGLQSYENKHEASMMVALCRYLLQQEYKPSQITILTMYTGQLLALKDMMPRKEFEGVRVTVVDNFQGEENDIILLSLVRSNTTGKKGSIGFLKESNRICVALSRARKGFYCIGNFGLLSKERLWKEICDDLISKESLSNSIQLACINHGNVNLVRNVEDFKKVPIGGCGLPCDLRLPCGHRCPSMCHGSDPEHANSRKCRKACSSLCQAELHRCQATCHYPAECELCPVPVSKIFPGCGHENMVACGVDPKMQICQHLDNKTLACGHQKAIPCFLDPLESLKTQRNKIREEKKALLHLKYTHRLSYALKPIKDEECNKYDAEIYILKEKLSTILKHRVVYESALKCEEKCQSLCKRGIHVCGKNCHYGKDCAPCTVQFEDEIPRCGHRVQATCNTNFEALVCEALCTRILECGHPCKAKCKVVCASYQCQMLCPNVCEINHPCRRTCHFGSPCDCVVFIDKVLPCNHIAREKCHVDASAIDCSMPCEKTRTCGHPCKRKCYEPCESSKCKVKELKTLSCSHEKVLPCHIEPSQRLCQEEVTKELPCGHNLIMPCNMDPLQYLCEEEVIKEIPCGHKIQMPCTMDPSKHTCTEEVTRELKCGHKIQMPCNMDTSKHICTEEAIRELVCGHKIQMPCNMDPSKLICTEEVTRELPCGHKIQMPCNVDTTKRKCVEIVERELSCGHKIHVPCEMDISKYCCSEQTTKTLPCGHEIQVPCNMDLSEHICREKMMKKLKCGHENQIPCHIDPSMHLCTTTEEIKLPCGHIHTNSCHLGQSHPICSQQVTRELSSGHEHQMQCHLDPSQFICTKQVQKKLPCDHYKLMSCHMNVAHAICTEQVVKTLQCGHENQMSCNFNPSEFQCKSSVKKELKCGHTKEVPCTKSLYEARIICNETVEKKLPCEHLRKIQCSEEPKDVLCDALVERELTCGHVKKVPCHGKNIDSQCREDVTKVLPCKHKKQMPCQENPENPDIKCDAMVTRELQCGHEGQVPCNMDVNYEISCDKLITRSLSCGHAVEVPCSMDISEISCDNLTKRSFPCGHDVEVVCNIDISEITCDKLTTRNLSCGHDFEVPCRMDISEISCDKLTTRNLPCGHDVQVPCRMDISEFSCDQLTTRSLPCGHDVEVPCRMNISKISCDKLTTRNLPCGHDVQVPCRMDISDISCDKLTTRILPCGHDVQVPCRMDISEISCDQLTTRSLPCGHDVEVPCRMDISEISCDKLTTRILPCGHDVEVPCRMDISEISCDQLTTRSLPCGHDVEVPCRMDISEISCDKLTTRILPCGHDVEVPCNMDINQISCDKLTTRSLPFGHDVQVPCGKNSKKDTCDDCGHEMELPCHVDVNIISCDKHIAAKILSSNDKTDKSCDKGISCNKLTLKSSNSTTLGYKQETKQLPCGHYFKMPCNTDISKIVCCKLTKKRLPCGHGVEMPCNEDINRVACEVSTRKQLSCKHEVEIPCHMDVNTISCNTLTSKTLPCSHTKDLPCNIDVTSILCDVLVMKKLSCKHEVEVPCNVDVNTISCDKLSSKTFPCGHIRQLPCNIDVSTILCEVPMVKKLPCNHEAELPCHEDQEEYICQRLCERFLPCNHQCKRKCYETCDPNLCTEITTKTAPCPKKHKMTVPCNVKLQDTFVCHQQVKTILKCGHIWQGECSESTLPFRCEVIERRTLACPGKHQIDLPCYVDIRDIPCDEQCSKILRCGHPCKLYCDEPCNPKKCDERVPKTFSPCGHKKWLPCGIVAKAICRYRCLRPLKDCGHPCQAFCGKPCNKPCFYKVRKTLPCGHKLKMKCCDPAEYVRCPSPCTAILPCGHICTGNCATCQEKGEHPRCPLPCGRALLCSHRCHNRCADTCSSCPRECRGWCPHGRCHGSCSESCEPCIMPCANTCPHRKCSNLCHEMCDQEPCNEPCHKMLTCGHPCIGLCGETCPTVCYVCTPAKVAAVSPNRQRNKDLRFIQLKECGHVIEVNRMDSWMQEPLNTAPNGQAQPRRCPACSVPIYFSFRYGNIVREALQMMFESGSFKEAREIAQIFTRRGARIRPIQYRKPKFR